MSCQSLCISPSWANGERLGFGASPKVVNANPESEID